MIFGQESSSESSEDDTLNDPDLMGTVTNQNQKEMAFDLLPISKFLILSLPFVFQRAHKTQFLTKASKIWTRFS